LEDPKPEDAVDREEREPITRESLSNEGMSWLLYSTFLVQLSTEEQDRVLSAMVWKQYDEGSAITRIHQSHSGIDLIVAGHATVSKHNAKGQLVPVANVEAGTLIGEASLVSGKAANAEVVARSRVLSLFMPAEAFHQTMRDSQRFRKYILELIDIREQWDTLLALLSHNDFLRALGREDIERLLLSGELMHLGEKELVVASGDESNDVFVVINGRLGVYGRRKDGGRERLTVKGKGGLVGDASLLLGTSRTADLETIGKCDLLRIDGTAFMDIVSRNPLVQRHLLQSLARLGFPAEATRKREKPRMVCFVCGGERKIGATTLAYGMTALFCDRGRSPVLVDTDGERSAGTLGLGIRDGKLGGIRIREVLAPSNWTMRVLWPADVADLGPLLANLRKDRQAASSRIPVFVSGLLEEAGARIALEVADAVVYARRAGDDLTHVSPRRGQVLIQAIRPEEGAILPLATCRKSARVPVDDSSARKFWSSGNLGLIAGTTTPLGRACLRLVRLLAGRSVGVALGGGGALGFAHVGLLRTLERAGIPVDYVAGVSFGSLVGALYVGGGLPLLEELIRKRRLLMADVAAAAASTRLIGLLVDHMCRGQKLSLTEIPFYPVGLDLHSGREFVLSEGSLGMGVRSSSCLPGVFPALNVGAKRLVDGGLINNVPASTIWEAGGDFIVASNIIPSNPEGNRPPAWLRLLGRVPILSEITRLDDTIRSLYMFMHQAGHDRSLLADFVFDLELEGFNAYDFHRGDEIADQGQTQAEERLTAIKEAWEQDESIIL
jgi:NTE family protein